MPRDFMERNRKLTRQELDANSKDFFWEKAAQVFNGDQDFNLIKPRSANTNSKTKYERSSQQGL